MKEGDVLIAKDNEFRGVSKYDKVIISENYYGFKLYRIENVNKMFSMIFTEAEVAHHYWTLAEHRKLKINELI